MFQKGKYITLLLLSLFTLRVCAWNIVLLNAQQHPETTLELKGVQPANQPGIAYRLPGRQVNLFVPEVSEESTENDASERIESVTKYPSLVLTLQEQLNGLISDNSTHLVAQPSHPARSARSYLTISVLRI